MDFLQEMTNGFLAKIAWQYLCQEGRRQTRIFVDTVSFGPKIVWAQNSEDWEKL